MARAVVSLCVHFPPQLFLVNERITKEPIFYGVAVKHDLLTLFINKSALKF